MTKVHIATSRPLEIGDLCTSWARRNMPTGFELIANEQYCDVFISVMYDKLLTEEFIKSRRCYNFHPGLLPAYKGSGSYSWVLINKATHYGITLHKIDKDIDHGPIIDKVVDIVPKFATAEELFKDAMHMMYVQFQAYFKKLLTMEYSIYSNVGGHLYLRKDLEEAKDISHIIRAFTFEGKESAYWYDSKGTKRYVEWK